MKTVKPHPKGIETKKREMDQTTPEGTGSPTGEGMSFVMGPPYHPRGPEHIFQSVK